MKRYRLEIEAVAAEMEFPDGTSPELVQQRIEEKLREMCDNAAAYYWEIGSKHTWRPPQRAR